VGPARIERAVREAQPVYSRLGIQSLGPESAVFSANSAQKNRPRLVPGRFDRAMYADAALCKILVIETARAQIRGGHGQASTLHEARLHRFTRRGRPSGFVRCWLLGFANHGDFLSRTLTDVLPQRSCQGAASEKNDFVGCMSALTRCKRLKFSCWCDCNAIRVPEANAAPATRGTR
jgi:hypothetical protein